MVSSSLQTAVNDRFSFAAPAVAASVLKFRVMRGGQVTLRFGNEDGEADITVSAEVSVDNVTYAATTAGNNGEAVTGVTVKRKQAPKSFTVRLRPSIDNYLSIKASGAAKGDMVIVEGGAGLQPMPAL